MVVLVLLGCGAVEVALRRIRSGAPLGSPRLAAARGVACADGGLPAVAWVAFKVGALSYGGGFVIVPLMQADAVDHYHWMTGEQFLNAVALGQITPGPVVQTVAVSVTPRPGSPADCSLRRRVRPLVRVHPARRRTFDRLRANQNARAFLAGAGPAAIGAIPARPSRSRARSPNPGNTASSRGGRRSLIVRRGVVLTLLAAGAAGAIASALGAPLPS